MTLPLGTVLSVLTTLGIGGLIGAYFQSLLERKNKIREREHELKHKRYAAITILMLTRLDPDANLTDLRLRRPEISDTSHLDNELRTELQNSFLFAGDEVVRALAKFVNKPSKSFYVKAVVAMRRDLWGRRTSINEDVLDAP